jgi:DNA-binding NtrC family response regulator
MNREGECVSRLLTSSSNKRRIVLVDDEKDIVTILKLGLEKHGYSVYAFTDPKTALEKYVPRFYDLSILDINMPGMSGFELATKIWSKDPTAKLCFLTSFGAYEKEARQAFKEFETFCFIKKPIPIQDLIRHIEERLRKD